VDRTTGIAALQRKLRFHGIEINPDYTALAEGALQPTAHQVWHE